MIIRAFSGPLLITFVVVLFILVMQFLWKYVDDLMGKGLEWYVLLELLTYATASFVPLALPLAILLSSIMTLGGLGENSELVPMRSAGMGLLRILFPLAVFVGGLGLASYFFSNNVLPVANLRFHSLLWDVTRKKPAMNLQPGIFYNGIDGFSIRAMQKDPDTGTLHDVLIYDHSAPFQGNRTVVRARSGTMQRSVDGHFLILKLHDGHFYDERSPAADRGKYPMMRGTFSEDEVKLDLSGLGLDRTDRDLFKDHYKMMSSGQLRSAEDSLHRQLDMRVDEQRKHLANSLYITRERKQEPAFLASDSTRRAEAPPPEQRTNHYDAAMNMVRNNLSFIEHSDQEREGREQQLSRFQIEWHRKRMLATACLLFFFIGAPLGAIIRRGGMGLPVVFAIIFFLIFHIVSFSTEKLVISGAFKAWPGMWISSMVLLPIAVLLTWKASTDSPLFDADAYYRGWERLRSLFRRSHAHPSTVQ